MSKLVGNILSLLGVLLMVGAIVVAMFIVPSQKVFPDDVDTTRVYELKYLTLLDPEAMEFHVFEEGHDVDLRIERHLVSVESNSSQTQIEEVQTIYAGDDVLLQNLEYHLVDRKTLEFLPEDETPESWLEVPGYIAREGLVMGWGLDVEQKDYDGWTDDYQTLVPLTFVRAEEHGGIATYYFTAEHEPKLIEEAYLDLMGLPKTLTLEQLQSLAGGIESIPFAVRALLPGLVNNAVKAAYDLDDDAEPEIPLVYYFDYWGEYWVEPTTGVLINTVKYENRGVSFPPEVIDALKVGLENINQDPDALDELLPLAVNTFEYEASAQSIEDARHDAEDAIKTIQTFETTIPMLMFVVGLFSLLLGSFVRKAFGQ